MYNRNYEVSMDSVAAYLADAVNKVKTQENPDVLNKIKKVFKKTVPFSMRMYVAAYLAKELQGNSRGTYRPSTRTNFRDNKKFSSSRSTRETKSFLTETSETRTPRPRVQIDPDLARTIFVNIGRNRRIFPRDLVGLLTNVAKIDRDRIGDIRVLANYSFVQIFAEDADKAIDALNDYDYRGRKLEVNYAHQKNADGSENIPEDEEIESKTTSEFAQTEEDAAAYAAAEKAAANNEPFSAPHLSSETEE